MLDQNTDRMWYVIGAVLIGAAIIFGMNTLMPNAFASVGDMFSSTLDNIDHMFDEYGYEETAFNMRNDLTIWDQTIWEDADATHEWLDNQSIRLTSGESYMGGVAIPGDFTEQHKTYKLSFDIQKLGGDVYGIGGHLLRTKVHSITIDGKPAKAWDLGMNRNTHNQWDDTVIYPNDTNIHHIEVVFTKILPDEENPISHNGNEVWIQPNRTKTNQYVLNAFDYDVVIRNVKLYQREVIPSEGDEPLAAEFTVK